MLHEQVKDGAFICPKCSDDENVDTGRGSRRCDECGHEWATHKYKIISLDVWGHDPGEHEPECERNGEIVCDGYTVNDAHYTGRTIEVVADEHVYNQGTSYESRSWFASDETIVRVLVDAGYLTEAAIGKVKIDGESDGLLCVDIDDDEDPEDGKPLLQLERVEE